MCSSSRVVEVAFSLLLLCGACGSSPHGATPTRRTADAGSFENPTDNPFDQPGPLVPSDAGSPDSGAQARDASASDAAVSGCGDGVIESGEVCDDGNSTSGDGCSADCTMLEQDFVCPAPGQKCVSTVACGDGRVAGKETCDDGNTQDGDGCSHDCALEPGYVCPMAGARCSAAKCGDGVVAGSEACDDGNTKDGDGCSSSCQRESGYACPDANKPCHLTQCNDGIKEGDEACDDGNQVVGDGCTPFCEVEPDCSHGACVSRCGDGMILPDDQEECDDGNTNDHDGCSSTCKIEPGYSCNIEQGALPEMLAVPVTYRDFVSFAENGSTRHPDFEKFKGSGATKGLVAAQLGSDGKPVYTGLCDASQSYPSGSCPYNQQMTTKDNFDQWYRDVPGVNVTKVMRMMLAHDPVTNTYQIQNSAFFPWDGDANSWPSQNQEQLNGGHDFGFTSEVRTYFECVLDPQHPQVLSFTGDDDVWVFINHKLAVDIGGLHSKTTDSVTLDAAAASALGIEAGKIYEIALFHAERHSSASNFFLTLDGFVSAKSQCTTKCGDGIVAGTETCDDGVNDGSYGSCTASCQRGPYCGDGVVQSGHEDCDDGVNLTTYSANGKPGCGPGCKLSAYCGDGKVDSLAGEQCDDGKNSGGYGQCGSGCKLGPRCGDHVVQAGESCDDGNLVSGDGCSSSCQFEGPA